MEWDSNITCKKEEGGNQGRGRKSSTNKEEEGKHDHKELHHLQEMKRSRREQGSQGRRAWRMWEEYPGSPEAGRR